MSWERIIQCLEMYGQLRMTKPEKSLLPGIKIDKAVKTIFELPKIYLTATNILDSFLSFFKSHLVYRTCSLMLKETELNYWWAELEDHLNRSCLSSLPGEWVDVQVYKCRTSLSCQMYFLYIPLGKQSSIFSAKCSAAQKLKDLYPHGEVGAWEGVLAHEPLCHGLRGMCSEEPSQVLQLLAPALHTWSLVGAVPGAHHGSFNLPGFSALPGSPCGVQGQGGPLWGISGNRKFSFTTWQASLVVLLESKPLVFLGSERIRLQNLTLNFTFSNGAGQLQKETPVHYGIEVAGLIHNLFVCQQECERTLKVDHYYFYHIPPLPWNSISISPEPTFFFSFCHMTWKIHYSNKYKLSQIRVASVLKSNLGFSAISPEFQIVCGTLPFTLMICSVLQPEIW